MPLYPLAYSYHLHFNLEDVNLSRKVFPHACAFLLTAVVSVSFCKSVCRTASLPPFER